MLCAEGTVTKSIVRDVGTRRAVSVVLRQGLSRWKRSTGTFPKLRYSKRDTGRSGLVRSALEKLSLFSPTFPVRQKHGAGNFAVCGQRLRGHVPSKNTSPTVLSWISLTSPTISVLFVSARCFEVLFLRFYGIFSAVSLQNNNFPHATKWAAPFGTAHNFCRYF